MTLPDPVEATVAISLAASVKTLFGPAAKEVGLALGRSAEARLRNFGRITEKAERKLGNALNEAGIVPLRVAGKLIDDASFCDDDLMLEYFGGVLAAARTPVGRDDRAAKWADLVARLSVYEVRTHYLIYRELRQAFLGTSLDMGMSHHLHSRAVYLPSGGYSEAMALGEGEPSVEEVADHAVTGLAREQLILPTGWVADPDVGLISAIAPGATEGGLVVTPSHAGVALFLWAHGYRGAAKMLFEPEREFDVVDEPLAIAHALVLEPQWAAVDDNAPPRS
jgi:hypothetical protein